MFDVRVRDFPHGPVTPGWLAILPSGSGSPPEGACPGGAALCALWLLLCEEVGFSRVFLPPPARLHGKGSNSFLLGRTVWPAAVWGPSGRKVPGRLSMDSFINPCFLLPDLVSHPRAPTSPSPGPCLVAEWRSRGWSRGEHLGALSLLELTLSPPLLASTSRESWCHHVWTLGQFGGCKSCPSLAFSGLRFSFLGFAKSVGARPSVFQLPNFCYCPLLSCTLCPLGYTALKKIRSWSS